jgi:hypothetical protein
VFLDTQLCCVVGYTVMLCCGVHSYAVLWGTQLCCVVGYTVMLCCGVHSYVVLWGTQLCCVVGYTVPNILKDYLAVILDCLTLKMKPIQSFKMSGPT